MNDKEQHEPMHHEAGTPRDDHNHKGIQLPDLPEMRELWALIDGAPESEE